jgi:hypothetical protein
LEPPSAQAADNVTHHGGRSLFQEQWWIDAASLGRSDQVEVAWDGKVVGRLFFVERRHHGLRHLEMPAYTRTLGPIFDLPPSKPFKRGQNIRRITQELVGKLPRHDYFYQVLQPCDESAFAFSLAGFHVGQRFTFRSSHDQSLETRWDLIDQKTRNLIRTASTRFELVETKDFDRFVMLCRQEFSGRHNHHNVDVLAAIFAACLQRDCARVLLALRGDGSAAAAVVLVWGTDTAYFWVSARDRSAPIGGANALLLWKSIEIAQGRGMHLDLDGYNSVAGAKFLAGFGENPSVRAEISWSGWRYDALECGRRPFRRLRSSKKELSP